MFKLFWLGLSVFLIFLIINRPPKTIGLKSISSKTNLLGSPSSAERFLNDLTIFLFVFYCFTVLLIRFLVAVTKSIL